LATVSVVQRESAAKNPRPTLAVKNLRLPSKTGLPARTGESVETPMVSQMEDFTSSRAFRITGAKAFAEARTTHQEFYCTGSRGGCSGH
jgi:hypothetical protein